MLRHALPEQPRRQATPPLCAAVDFSLPQAATLTLCCLPSLFPAAASTTEGEDAQHSILTSFRLLAAGNKLVRRARSSSTALPVFSALFLVAAAAPCAPSHAVRPSLPGGC